MLSCAGKDRQRLMLCIKIINFCCNVIIAIMRWHRLVCISNPNLHKRIPAILLHPSSAMSTMAHYESTTVASLIIHSTDVAVASAALIVYDHVITFDQEVNLFWTGPWDASRFSILAKAFVVQALSDFMSSQKQFRVSNPTALLIADIVLITLGAALCQAVIALRVWYLFSRNKLIRRFAALLYFVCICSTWTLIGFLFNRIYQEMQHPSLIKNPSIFAVVYAPAFVNHSVLFGLKVYRYMTSDRFQRRSSLLGGFLKDQVRHRLSYLSCYRSGSILYTIISISLTNVSQLDVFVVGATLVSVCHALLSIRSISATLHVDPAWLLNHAELSRVHWTKGDHDGEIFVELDGYNEAELPMMNLSGMDILDADLGAPTKSQ
ncbi:uncharacterized protein EDB91DRAFT_1143208 [Suillus paluster]|uniref:uncharacterized protein n=1 Tax=Suillus paluster TaxID=48578 RepID=UPI001B85FDCF|nr:uncharacterized protein EDB91DRAFT_1143208 [Suillus paluster]KAG1736171.1 hypothetical protein EDB91DRAFT_1143208 [Suillus paluster]